MYLFSGAKAIEMKGQASGAATEEIDEQIRRCIPPGRFVRSRTWANVVAFLAPDEASFVTEPLYLVSGGSIGSGRMVLDREEGGITAVSGPCKIGKK